MRELISISPWTGEELLRLRETSSITREHMISERFQEFPRWSAPTMLPARSQALSRFREVLVRERQAIVALLIREAGKVRIDAEAEADLLPRKITISLNEGLARTPMAGEGPVHFRARGVALCLGPYNFPLHLLHGLVVPALLVGCTVIAKPSERCPALGQLYAEMVSAAGLEQVLSVVHGDSHCARELVADERVMTVAAVGGRAMGLALSAQLAKRPQVVLALELGGVNPVLVLDDADVTSSCAAIAEGAWRMAGQRCTASRVLHVPRALVTSWMHGLQHCRRDWLPGTSPEAAAGPMISATVREEFQRPYRELPRGLRLLAGSTHSSPGSCNAEPLLLLAEAASARESALYREEHFGPALIIDAYDDLDEVLSRMAGNPYRLSCSVFSASRERFRRCALALPYGLVNWNRPTAGARSEWPFGGLGLSGNGRPAAVAAGAIFCDESVIWE